MDKLDLLFNPKQFADAFGAVACDSRLVAMEPEPDASVWVERGASAGGEFAWDQGQIDYRGDRHSFSISGLSIADVRAVNISATGIVKRLKRLSDFVGNYLAAAAAGGFAARGDATYLRNDRGVLIQLVAAGHHINVSINGVEIRFRQGLR